MKRGLEESLLCAKIGTLTLRISLNSNQLCAYFCKDLVTKCCLYLVKNSFISQSSSVFKLILLPKTCCYGLMSGEIRVYRKKVALNNVVCSSASNTLQVKIRVLQHLPI